MDMYSEITDFFEDVPFSERSKTTLHYDIL